MAEHEDMKKDMPMPKPTMPMPPEGARTLNEAMPPEGVEIAKRPDQSIQMVLL